MNEYLVEREKELGKREAHDHLLKTSFGSDSNQKNCPIVGAVIFMLNCFTVSQ